MSSRANRGPAGAPHRGQNNPPYGGEQGYGSNKDDEDSWGWWVWVIVFVIVIIVIIALVAMYMRKGAACGTAPEAGAKPACDEEKSDPCESSQSSCANPSAFETSWGADSGSMGRARPSTMQLSAPPS